MQPVGAERAAEAPRGAAGLRQAEAGAGPDRAGAASVQRGAFGARVHHEVRVAPSRPPHRRRHLGGLRRLPPLPRSPGPPLPRDSRLGRRRGGQSAAGGAARGAARAGPDGRPGGSRAPRGETPGGFEDSLDSPRGGNPELRRLFGGLLRPRRRGFCRGFCRGFRQEFYEKCRAPRESGADAAAAAPAARARSRGSGPGGAVHGGAGPRGGESGFPLHDRRAAPSRPGFHVSTIRGRSPRRWWRTSWRGIRPLRSARRRAARRRCCRMPRFCTGVSWRWTPRCSPSRATCCSRRPRCGRTRPRGD